ncbi:hypothetical protein ACHAXT_007725 [Thalassiosira profunda]
MASLASSGEMRRRKNPAKQPVSSSTPTTSEVHATLQKRRRPGDVAHAGDGGRSSAPKPAVWKKEYDEYAWFIVFLAALSYFVVTRGGNSSRGGVLSSFSKPYDVAASSVAIGGNRTKSEGVLRSTFCIAANSQKEGSSLELAPYRQLEVILSSPPDAFDGECTTNDGNSIPYLSHLSSTTWVHDEELGRGYLLLADAGRAGRIWRWEVGGGPITIGRSLHMERSGCRSGLWVDADGGGGSGRCPENLFGDSAAGNETQASCPESSSAQSTPPLLGSASLAVELTRNAERASAGKNLLVAEWGERRIIRLEGESGARTPLVTTVPMHDGQGERRVYRPNHLTYTPFGDLLFSDNFESEGANNTSSHAGVVYRKKEAVHAPPIAAEMSREAHGWKQPQHNATIDVLFQTEGLIEGMALGSDVSTLYVLVNKQTASTWTKTLYKLPLGSDDDGEEEGGEEAGGAGGDATALYEMSAGGCDDSAGAVAAVGSKLAVDEKGTIYVIGCPNAVSLLSDDGDLIGTLARDGASKASSFTSVSFGEDGYLYITSPNELLRVKARVGGASLPTDLVVPPPLKSA